MLGGRGHHKVRKEAGDPDAVGGVGLDERPAARRVVVCANCMHVLCDAEARVARDGKLTHRCVNPAGAVFEIGCYLRVGGVEHHGPVVVEHSWFAGYGWQIAACAGCSGHVGWAFRATDHTPFWGLILDRVRESDR